MIGKARKVMATSVLAAAGVLALGAFGSTAMAATSAPAVAPLAAGAAQLDPRCGCLPGPEPRPEKPKPSPAPEQPSPSEPSGPSTPGTGNATCPAVVPSHPTGADYVNAWNQSGMCLGAGAAGLVSSAWAGAIPSIVQGAAGSVRSDDAGSLTAPVVVPAHPTGADYVNAWNKSGALAGAGAAGLVSSAWAGAIPSIVQGAAGSVSTPDKAAVAPKSHESTVPKTASESRAAASKSTKDRKASVRHSEGLTAPVVVPAHPTGADYVNAWNKSGALAGAGAAGLVSSAWAGAIPSIVQGATGSLG